MYDKEKDLVQAYLDGRTDRRGLLRGMSALGASAAFTSALIGLGSTRAFAAGFDAMQHKGASLKLLLNKHPYTDAMIANLEAFKAMTGIDVAYDIFPEDVYFDKVTAALSTRSSEYDVFMTGAYMTWTYGPAGWITDLNDWIRDENKTSPAYDWEDMLPGLRASTAWNGIPGGALGSEGAKQWCIPWGYELNNLSYNRNMFEQAGVEAPANMGELLEVCAKLDKDLDRVYPVGVRGSRSWATIHPGFLSGYSNFGERDLTVGDDGTLSAAMNTEGSKAFHRDWVRMIQDYGPKNWSTYTWYQVGTDLGAGASAMIFDADILGYFMNGGDNKEAGNIAYAPFAANPAADAPTPNVWIWSLSMSNFSEKKECRVALHAVGLRGRARAVRRPADGLRQSGPPGGLGRPDLPGADRPVLSGLSAPARRLGAGRADLLHRAAALLRSHHGVGGVAPEDGRQRSPGGRGAGHACGEREQSARRRRTALIEPVAAARPPAGAGRARRPGGRPASAPGEPSA